MDYSVILPVYNEAESLEALIQELVRTMASLGRRYEVICVNDGSTDASAAVLARIKSRHPEVRVLQFDRNYGQSAALAAGFQAAQGEVLITLDSDLQNDPRDIPKLLSVLEEECDMVCGIRRKRRDSLSKRLGSRFANAVRRLVLGDHIEDIGCTLKVFRQSCLSTFVYFKGAHRFFPVFVEKAGFRIKQVPVEHHPRRAGCSKYSNLQRAWVGVGDLWMVRRLLKRSQPYRVIS